MSETERGLILLRTHFVDARIDELARAYAAGGDYDVMIAIDETSGPVDTQDIPKLSMSLDSCARLGLNVAFDQPLWRCGDYVFYHALNLGLEYRWFWLVEYDVVINYADPLDFFRFIDAQAGDDYLCCGLRLAGADWYWTKRAARQFSVVHHALFPLIRLAPAIAQKLLARRQADALRLRASGRDFDKDWANDESFVSSAVHELGVAMADFNAYGDFYSESSFACDLLRHVSEMPATDGKIYHAVRSGPAYLRALGGYYRASLETLLSVRDPGIDERDYHAALVDRLVRLLKGAPDDPNVIFSPTGRLAEMKSYLGDFRVAEAVLRALGRLRMRLCLEALQFGRIAFPLARTESFDNVALGRLAWQSSTPRGSRSRKRNLSRDAEGGNDGNLKVEYGFLTAHQEEPWWAVDLGVEMDLAKVRLYNRRGVEQRLRLFVIETSPDFVSWTTVFAHLQSEMKLLLTSPIEIDFDPPARARYLRIRLARRGVLHLAEVEVFKA